VRALASPVYRCPSTLNGKQENRDPTAATHHFRAGGRCDKLHQSRPKLCGVPLLSGPRLTKSPPGVRGRPGVPQRQIHSELLDETPHGTRGTISVEGLTSRSDTPRFEDWPDRARAVALSMSARYSQDDDVNPNRRGCRHQSRTWRTRQLAPWRGPAAPVDPRSLRRPAELQRCNFERNRRRLAGQGFRRLLFIREASL